MILNIPEFSVIVPTYNRALFVKRAINSILAQKFQNYEVIVMDDASSDNTSDIINSINDKRIKYMKHNQNRGASAARNTAVKKSVGEYLAFLDSDDEAHPDWLLCTAEKIKMVPESWGVIYPNRIIRSAETGISYPIIRKPMEGYIYEILLRKHGQGALTIGLSGAVIEKSIFEDIGGFDENLFGYHDYDLYYRIAQKYTFHFINKFLIIFLEHNQSRLMCDSDKREEAKLIYDKKWEKEIRRVGAEATLGLEIQKFLSPREFVSHVRTKGRYKSLIEFFHLVIEKKVKSKSLAKYLIAFFIGAHGYDLFRKWKNHFYWRFIYRN